MEKLSPGRWLTLEQETLNTKTDGKTLIDLTAYQGIALWWFIRFKLYHSAQSTRLIKLAIENPYLFSLTELIYDFVTSMVCKALSSFFKARTDKRRHRVLMTAHNIAWRNVQYSSGELRKCDILLDSLINELKKRDFEVITVSPLKYSVSGLKTMLEKLQSQKNTVHREFNIYWSIKTWKKGYDARRHFRSVWKNASRNDGKFMKSLGKYGFRNELSTYFNSVFGHVVKTLEMAKDLVEKEKPDLILVTSEYGIFERALVVAGKLKKIPTLALQHGFIGPHHEGYIYSKKSISAFGSVEAPYCPIPDKTAVYGQYYYYLLTKMSSYPPSSLEITGQPRYDILAIANRVYSREKFCSKFNLDPNGKIVLVGTENLPIPMGKMLLRSFLKALKSFPELQIVVKPHPGERGEWYKNVVKEENVNAVMLSKDADTFEALYACDLLLTDFSTIVTEAIILGKPSVTLHPNEGEDPAPHYREVTLRVYREADLVSAIREALYDEKARDKLRKEGKKFVHEHVYNQDGKATERIANLIESMIKKELI